MSTPVLLAVLASAVLHAVWNALAHGIRDRLVGFTLIGVAYTLVGLAVVLVAGLPAPSSWGLVVAGGLLEAAYLFALLRAYDLGDFSQAYPLARGTSPWVVALVSTVFLGQTLARHELLGVLVVSAGLIALVLVGGVRRAHLPAIAAAVATGLVIAAYTLVDAAGVHHTSVATYGGWMFLISGPFVPAYALRVRGRALLRQVRPSLATGIGGGVVSTAAYGIVLWAQARGSTAPIAALREVSIVIGAVIGAVFLGERLGRGRAAAGAVVVLGIVLMNL